MTLKDWQRDAAALALLSAAFLVVQAPAALLGPCVARASRGMLALAQPSGTVWKGRAELVSKSGETPHLVARLAWTISPLWLAVGRLGLRVEAEGPRTRLRGLAYIRKGAVSLRDVDLVIPARLALGLLPSGPWAGLEGELQVTSPSLSLDADGVRGGADLILRDAASPLAGSRSLGDYRVELHGQDGAAWLVLGTLRGVLLLSGVGQWRPAKGGRFEFSGVAKSIVHGPEGEALGRFLGGAPGAEAPFKLNSRLQWP